MKRIVGHPPKVEWRSVCPSWLQQEESSTLAVFASADIFLLLRVLGTAVGKAADDLVVEEGPGNIMLNSAFEEIGTSVENAEALLSPGDMGQGKRGQQNMVGRSFWLWGFPSVLARFFSSNAVLLADQQYCQWWTWCRGSFGRLVGGMRR